MGSWRISNRRAAWGRQSLLHEVGDHLGNIIAVVELRRYCLLGSSSSVRHLNHLNQTDAAVVGAFQRTRSL